MKVSNNNVKRFLMDVIDQTSFPGKLVEFVAAVKAEVAGAEIENTASDRMLSLVKEGNNNVG